MLNRRHHRAAAPRPGPALLTVLALLAALCGTVLAAWPGPAAAAVRHPGSPVSGMSAADSIRDNQQWVLDMLDVPAAWTVTRGTGVTVAVIDSGVNPAVSDLSGSVLTGPNYTGVTTRPSSTDWGVHGTWMASLIAGHGHDGGTSGVIGIAPAARVLSIRVIPDRGDPDYTEYEREQETSIQQSLANGINYAVAHGAQVISMSIGYSAPSGTVREALEQAYDHGVVVVASAGNSGDSGLWPRQRGAGVVSGELPGRDRRGRGGLQRQGGRLLQQQRLRPDSRAGGLGPGAGPGRAVLVGERDQPGLRAGGRSRRADQVEVSRSGA